MNSFIIWSEDYLVVRVCLSLSKSLGKTGRSSDLWTTGVITGRMTSSWPRLRLEGGHYMRGDVPLVLLNLRLRPRVGRPVVVRHLTDILRPASLLQCSMFTVYCSRKMSRDEKQNKWQNNLQSLEIFGWRRWRDTDWRSRGGLLWRRWERGLRWWDISACWPSRRREDRRTAPLGTPGTWSPS